MRHDKAAGTRIMFEIILYEPEIPPNAGNIMRLCANTGCRLHLVRPLGFSLSNKQLARAGMDYRAGIDYFVHDDWPAFLSARGPGRMFAVTTRGVTRYDEVPYKRGDTFVFGPETHGLPHDVLSEFGVAARVRLPMLPGNRSLNV